MTQSQLREEQLKRFVKDIVCQIRCRPEGYDRVRQLAVDFNADCGQDPETISRRLGYDSFTDFLHSSAMRTEIDIRNDQGVYVYVARPNPLVSHIHAEQMRSRHAREKKQEKERYYEQSAGTIGRRTYGDDGFYNPPSDSFSVGLQVMPQSRQPDQHYLYSRDDAPSHQSQVKYRYENPSPRDSAWQGGRQLSNGFRDDRHYDNEPLSPRGRNYQESRLEQPADRNDFQDDGQPQRSYNNLTGYDHGDDDRRGNTPPLGFDTGLQQPTARVISRSGSRCQPAMVRSVERPIRQRDTPLTQKVPEDPVSVKNVTLTRQPAPQPLESKMPPVAEAAAAASEVVWEENDDEEEDDHIQANPGLYDAVSSSSTTAGFKQLEANRRTVSDSMSDDNDDSPPPRQTAASKSDKKDASPPRQTAASKSDKKDAPPSSKSTTTQWTSRALDGEFTDSDDDEDDDEEEVDKAAEKMAKVSLYQNVTTFPETKGTLKPRVVLSVNSSSDTSTLHNEQSLEKTLSPLKKKDSSVSVINPPARLPSTITMANREPASHGEKWLFEMKRQQEQRSQRDLANVTPMAPLLATKSASVESTTTTAFRPISRNSTTAFRPVSRNSTTAPVGEPPDLHRPIVVEPDKSADKIADWVNEKSLPKSKTTANITGSASVPLRCTGSMTSVFSTATSRRWSRVLSDDDLKRMSLVVNSIVQYHFPRTVFLDDLVAVVEMVEPRFASLEQSMGGEFLQYLERFCQRVEVIGRAGHHHLLWRDDEKIVK